MVLRGTAARTSSSSRAAAIQPGPCLGLVWITDFSSSRAFLMSLISASGINHMGGGCQDVSTYDAYEYSASELLCMGLRKSYENTTCEILKST